MTKGVASRAFIPPQRLAGESKTHYLKLVNRQIEAWRKIRDDSHNNRDQRKKARHRMHLCVQARDKCLMGRE